MHTLLRVNFVWVITVFALLFCLASTGEAVPTYFTDRNAFNLAAGGGLNFESFETQLVNAPQPSYTFAGFSAKETNGLNFITDVLSNSAFSNTPVTDGENAIWYDDNSPDYNSIFTFYNPTNAVNSFGLDITTSENSSVTIGGTYTLNFIANTPQFFGAIDFESLGYGDISFEFSGGPLVGFDAVSYGLASSVPEPATLLLFGAGLAALGIMRKRLKV